MHVKSLQSCLTLCNPIDSSPPGSPVHRILQARIVEWVAISFSAGDMNLSKLREMVRDGETGVLQSLGSQRIGDNLATEQQ